MKIFVSGLSDFSGTYNVLEKQMKLRRMSYYDDSFFSLSEESELKDSCAVLIIIEDVQLLPKVGDMIRTCLEKKPFFVIIPEGSNIDGQIRLIIEICIKILGVQRIFTSVEEALDEIINQLD